ncbi:MAG: hypothetical protein AAFQ62_11340 [Pseudomonadota bacterium]
MSEYQPSRKAQWAVYIIVFAVSTAIAVVLFEIMMQQSRQGTVAMRVTTGAYGIFDDALGVRYEPDSSSSYAYLDSTGRVLECLPSISKTNADGYRGLDTQADYQAAAQRLLVSGDSFSHWNIDGKTIVDYTKTELNERGLSAALLNVAGGTFGLEHMVVHLADALETPGVETPNLIAIQFIRDDITRDWWYLDTVEDSKGRPRARLSDSVACLAADSGCGSDEYLIDARATQSWCESRKGKTEPDAISTDLVATYDDLRGFFVYLRRALARLGLVERQSVIPRVVDIAATDTNRIQRAIDVIKASGATVLLIYLPTSGEIAPQQVYSFNATENAVLAFYEQALGVNVIYPSDYDAFAGIETFAVSPFDSHPSIELQQGYGRYLAALFAEALDAP